ncbi:hypothetical protein EVAR_65821_1 [Eumeta japonica]|uniref:Uncharacterized protein n=1 Tax=Eumeta variegata TaxID=151549 RepID=A0A4C1ZM45_EUMVA|nr:hypothetical protein EVAR_65821_1 [Eumeta japonica]
MFARAPATVPARPSLSFFQSHTFAHRVKIHRAQNKQPGNRPRRRDIHTSRAADETAHNVKPRSHDNSAAARGAGGAMI